MSYTGNSKEAIVQLAGVDVVISNLQSDLTSEISNRVAQDGVLNGKIDDVNNGLFNYIHSKHDQQEAVFMAADTLIKTDVSNLQSGLSSEISNRTAQDGVLNAKIDDVNNGLFNYISSMHDQQQTAFMAADNLIKADITALTTSTTNLLAAASTRLTTLETGLTAQVNEMISNNALDVVQSNLISQYAASLSEADSVIYERIAEKSGLIAVNAFRTKFNSYLNDWFGAYTLNINNVAKTAADYQIPAKVSVNQDPNL